MTEQEEAYKEAEKLIEKVIRENGTYLDLHFPATRSIEKLPSLLSKATSLKYLHLQFVNISDLTPLETLVSLERLWLENTNVRDITPLKGLVELQELTLYATRVEDITPLKKLRKLRSLELSETKVRDLSIVLHLDALLDGDGLGFENTPAANTTPELQLLSKIESGYGRTNLIMEYLEQKNKITSRVHKVDTFSTDPTELHIQKLLEHAAVTKITAQSFSSQIRFLLADVPAQNGNELPKTLQSYLHVAEIFDKIAMSAFESSSVNENSNFVREIKYLEKEIAELSKHLTDKNAALEAAQALATSNTFWQKYKASAATTAGAGTVALIGLGVPTAITYLLGADNQIAQSYIAILNKLAN